LKANPEAWSRSRIASWTVTGTQAWEEAWGEARTAARNARRDQEWYAARHATSLLGMDRVWGVILALIAWDRSAQFLDMTSNELKMWGALSEDPAAILMLTAVIAFEQIKELETVDI